MKVFVNDLNVSEVMIVVYVWILLLGDDVVEVYGVLLVLDEVFGVWEFMEFDSEVDDLESDIVVSLCVLIDEVWCICDFVVVDVYW